MLHRFVKLFSKAEWFCLFILLALFLWLTSNLQQNLQEQSIATGFSFLAQESGFEVSESLIPFGSADSYGKALLAGGLNTLKVALPGLLASLFFGLLLCWGLLARHPLVSRLALSISDLIRNTPLILQLFLWYAIITDFLPPVRSAFSLGDLFFLTNRGFFYPILGGPTQFKIFLALVVLLCFLYYFLEKKSVAKFYATGIKKSSWPKFLTIYFTLLAISWWLLGKPTRFSIPELQGFNFQGGDFLSPEYAALTFGLVVYTGVFMADIFKAGIQSVSKGQWEAGYSLGLGRWDRMRLIIFPQALRVAIPPLTGQILNLVKNSSLAVAIAYPDFVSVANTTLNQTGQAIELVTFILLFYLTSSLVISFIMNKLNARLLQRGSR